MKSLINLKKFTSNPMAFMDEQFSYDKGPVQSLRIGPKKFHMVFDPQLAQDVLVTKSQNFVQNRSIFDRIKPITGEKGIVQLNGEESRLARQKVRPMFSTPNLEEMNHLVTRNTKEALECYKGNSTVDISSFLADLVLRNAFGLFLGLDISKEAASIASEFRELNILCGKRMVSLCPMPLMLPTLSNLRIKELKQSLRSKISFFLQKKVPSSTNVHKIFLNDKTLVDQCMTFIFAGHETTASSLTFTLLLLGLNPKYSKLINEGGDDVALAVYKESLRLFPPAYMLAREAAHDTKLLDVDIFKGDQILIGVRQIHRHPAFHDRADEFIPERFSGSVKAFLPFGLGPKSCIGEKLAYMEAVTIIRIFCKRFNFRMNSKKISCHPLVTLHPSEGQYLHLEEVHYG